MLKIVALVSFATTVSASEPAPAAPAAAPARTLEANTKNFECGESKKVNGKSLECDPNGDYPCCSAEGWCGNTAEHCENLTTEQLKEIKITLCKDLVEKDCKKEKHRCWWNRGVFSDYCEAYEKVEIGQDCNVSRRAYDKETYRGYKCKGSKNICKEISAFWEDWKCVDKEQWNRELRKRLGLMPSNNM